MESLTIGKLAKAAGVPTDTVRFYERARLLRLPPRSASGYRRYAAADVERLAFIRRAKSIGFSLEEIRELLRLNDSRGSRARVRQLAQHRLDEVELRLKDLDAIRTTLRHLLGRCHGDGPLEGCPIIDAVLAVPPMRRTRRSS